MIDTPCLAGPIRPGPTVLSQGQRLSAAQVIVKLAVARLAEARGELVVGEGVRQRALLAYARDYSGHSLRVGAAQDMAAVGIGTAAIHNSSDCVAETMSSRSSATLATDRDCGTTNTPGL